MATYKVIQDIEAEDKLLGPLTLRQFIYAVICCGFLFLCYLLVSRGVAFLVPVFLIPAAIMGFLAFPFSKDQSTELWTLARLNFLFKPRKRIWDQSGAKDLVTVTAPKKEVKQYTDGLTQHEVKSRLRALAETIDSRGWAVKNAGANYVDPAVFGQASNPDRLIDAAALPQEVSAETYEDPLDPSRSSQIGQHFDEMLQANERQKKERLLATMQNPASTGPAVNPLIGQTSPANQPAQPQDYWFMNQSTAADGVKDDSAMFKAQVVNPGSANQQPADTFLEPKPTSEETELINQLKHHQDKLPQSYSHMPTVLPLDEQRKIAQARQKKLASEQALAKQQLTADKPAAKPDNDPAAIENARRLVEEANSNSQVTDTANAVTMKLAQDDDKNIATIARMANQQAGKTKHNSDGSVEISLH